MCESPSDRNDPAINIVTQYSTGCPGIHLFKLYCEEIFLLVSLPLNKSKFFIFLSCADKRRLPTCTYSGPSERIHPGGHEACGYY
jgi:hypothetical protein